METEGQLGFHDQIKMKNGGWVDWFVTIIHWYLLNISFPVFLVILSWNPNILRSSTVFFTSTSQDPHSLIGYGLVKSTPQPQPQPYGAIDGGGNHFPRCNCFTGWLIFTRSTKSICNQLHPPPPTTTSLRSLYLSGFDIRNPKRKEKRKVIQDIERREYEDLARHLLIGLESL